jgi:hypothetical protein
VGVIFFVRGTGAVVVVVVVVVGGGLYLVALLVVVVGVGRAHVNSSARVETGVGRLGGGGAYATSFIMFMIDLPYVRKR